MHMKSINFKMLTFILLFFSSLMIAGGQNCHSKSGDDFRLDVKDTKTFDITRNDDYDGNSLWGYIDGGADLYLEYGFTNVAVQEVKHKGEVFKIEIWHMKNKEAAFGLYSTLCYKCSNFFNLDRMSCETQYQISTLDGPYVINIINTKGNKEAQDYSKYLTKKLMIINELENAELPKLFTKLYFSADLNNLKLIVGKLGFQNIYPSFSKYFEELTDYKVYLLNIEKDTTLISQMTFKNEKDKKQFLSNFKMKTDDKIYYYSVTQDSTLYAYLTVNNNEIIFIESTQNNTKLPKHISSIKDFLKNNPLKKE
jgi:hypothetical protein